jgi:hypothetical protein
MPKLLASVSVTCAAALVLLVLATSANADALYFEKGPVKTSSERTCLRFAGDVARNQSFKNTHSNALEVAGEKDGVYVSITCVGRGQQPAIVIVMAVASTFDKAKQVGSFVAGRVKAITCIDSPC